MEENTENPPLTQIIPKNTPSDSTKPYLKYIIIGFVVFIIVVLSFFFLQKNSSKKIVTLSPTPDIPKEIQPSLTIIKEPSPTTPLPDFSNESVKPKTNIDISIWKTFDDPSVGLRFKYPNEWTFESGRYPKIYQSDTIAGPVISYGGTFNFSKYNIFGFIGHSEKVVDMGEGGNWDFTGIDLQGNFCTKNEYLKFEKILFCIQTDSTAHVLIGGHPRGGGGGNLISIFKRGMYLYKPNKVLPYFKFSGKFLSEKYAKIYDDYHGSYNPTKMEYEKFNQAILDRRLDEESMKNFDTIEKVFETVESY